MTAASWAPTLPDHWRITTLRRVARVFAGGTPDRKDQTFWSNGDIPWINSGAINQDTITTPSAFVTEHALRNGTTRWVNRKSVLIALAGQGKTKGMAARTEIKTTLNQSLAAIEPGPQANYRYLHYWMKSNYKNIRGLSGGDLRDGLNLDHIGSIEVPLPPEAEQERIADYLDHETAEIDAFINQQSRLIALLDERRMATAGELIRYPVHFDDGQLSRDGLAPLKHLGTITLGKMLDTKQLDSTSTMHPYLRAANVQPLGVLKLDDLKKMRFTDHEKRALTILAGDVVVVEGGVGGFGRAAFVPTDLPGVGFQNSIIRVRPNKQSDGRFIAYALILLRHRGYINTVSSVSSMPHFTAEKVARTPAPRLARARQSEIADELDSLWRTHSIASADAQLAIDLARERRAALITAAVTGQIDVTARNKPAAEQLEDDIAQGLHREYA